LPASAAAASLDGPTPTSSKAPTAEGTPAPASDDPVVAEPPPAAGPQPMSSKAPKSEERAEPEPEEATPPPKRSSPPPPTKRRRGWKGGDVPFARHGIGARGGITMIPTWLLKSWFATHTNALCRGGSIGNFAKERGIVQQDGCNYYIGGEYIHRFNRVFDLAASVGYQRLAVPPGLWLTDKEYDASRPESLASADYTEIDMGFIFLEIDAIARVPLVVTKDVEFGIGGGGGLGLGIITGSIHQTSLGAAPTGYTDAGGATAGTCNTPEDFADTRRCTPRYDVSEDGDMIPPDESDLSSPNPALFANCSKTKCNTSDLNAFGYRQRQGGVPPVIPVLNLLVSARLIIKDAVGIAVTGGFQTGFYFGGSLQYFFGAKRKDQVGLTAAKKKPGRVTVERGSRGRF